VWEQFHQTVYANFDPSSVVSKGAPAYHRGSFLCRVFGLSKPIREPTSGLERVTGGTSPHNPQPFRAL
jgi:hypothetical protein